jgi:hypothetical protein
MWSYQQRCFQIVPVMRCMHVPNATVDGAMHWANFAIPCTVVMQVLMLHVATLPCRHPPCGLCHFLNYHCGD